MCWSTQTLASAIEERDAYTRDHSETVVHLARGVALILGMSAASVERIAHAALLHDVGKLGVPDAILLKPGRLTDDERAEMQTHTTIGATILAGSSFPILQLGEQIAQTHHERWDGTGYPRQIAGEAIPMAGRIVAVADVFDALTHSRPYKQAWPLQDAVDEIARCAGSQFDPVVVKAFQRLHREGGLAALIESASGHGSRRHLTSVAV